ncbi:MAG: MerR family transcriptional regulator [Mycobacteriaceae bacterium]|nr:MerR family transcriptional regulator [Mycobacteriaceae bacterium]
MTALLTIGEFSRLTLTTVKALRHYHDIGLLTPAEIHPHSGYRRYSAAQAPTAQLIHRFRKLDMSLDQIRTVLTTTDPVQREHHLTTHLERMQHLLTHTSATVDALRDLLDGRAIPPSIEFRTLPETMALSIRESVPWSRTLLWLRDAYAELRDTLRREGRQRGGPDSALYGAEFFEHHAGEVTAFIPVKGMSDPHPLLTRLPSARVAATTHRGGCSTVDRAYAALGTFVAERGLHTPGPIREQYHVFLLETDDRSQWITDVFWPIPSKPPE